MAEGPFVLSIDVGTSSTRAALFDRVGMPQGRTAQRANRLGTDVSGMAVLSPAELLEGVCSVVDEVMAASPGSPVAAVGVSCFWHSLLGVDSAGKPTTEILTWADRRAGGVAAAQRALVSLQQGSSTSLHRRTGCPLHSSYWTAKLPWLRETVPGIWARTAGWLSASDHLMATLFGETRTSVSMASGTGLFDLWSLSWSPEAIALAGVDRSTLPAFDDRPYLGLVPPFAGRWDRLAEVPWFPAVGDGACSNLGVGGTGPDTLVLMLGTSGSLRMVWGAGGPHPADPGMWFYRIDERRLAGGMALSEGGASAAWARATVGRDEWIEGEIDAMAPDAHGLTVLPYVHGTRSPDWLDGRTACIAGITAATTPADMQRAMLESVGLSIAALKARLETTIPRARRVVVTGGALSRSATWRSIVADCIGQDVELSEIDEGSLRGAAIIALERLGHAKLEDFAHGLRARTRHDPRAHDIYVGALDRRNRLDQAMRALAL